AMIENACMWGILGSNRMPLKYVSRVDHRLKKRHFEQNHSVSIPDFDLERKYYTPLEVRAGDAVFFHGNFVHCSPVNSSSRGRPAISLQFIETANTHYPETNWLQPPNRETLFELG
ncbi:MAG: phytanoyl-CoA dioxygenase family protein, partial [Cryobacterium sp.]|nr:phytanoyl-CoA dioxygenase family protein [Oligoflexia bacterium]